MTECIHGHDDVAQFILFLWEVLIYWKYRINNDEQFATHCCSHFGCIINSIKSVMISLNSLEFGDEQQDEVRGATIFVLSSIFKAISYSHDFFVCMLWEFELGGLGRLSWESDWFILWCCLNFDEWVGIMG